MNIISVTPINPSEVRLIPINPSEAAARRAIKEWRDSFIKNLSPSAVENILQFEREIHLLNPTIKELQRKVDVELLVGNLHGARSRMLALIDAMTNKIKKDHCD